MPGKVTIKDTLIVPSIKPADGTSQVMKVHAGQPAEIHAIFDGSPLPRASWKREGMNLPDFSMIQGTDTSTTILISDSCTR